MKSAGIIIVCSAVLLAGVLSVRQRQKRAALLKNTSEFFCELKKAAASGAHTLEVALSIADNACVNSPAFVKAVLEGCLFGEDLCSVWKKSVSCWCEEHPELLFSEVQVLLSYSDAFMSVSADEFCRKTKAVQDSFFELYTKQHSDNSVKNRLTFGLSMLGSVLLFIILM